MSIKINIHAPAVKKEFANKFSKCTMFNIYTVIGTSVLTKPILCYKRPNFTMPFYYVKVPKSKNELTYVQVGQKRPFTQKIRSLAQKMAILVF